MAKKLSIPRAETPEEVGVDSEVVQAFLDKCTELGKEFHSLMVIRHGKVACEVYREPFNAKSRHMMYSVSKSVTSTAIGFAIDEGYLSLETKFLDIFPEFRNVKKPDAFLEELCVEDLLTMRGGKSVSPMSNRSKDTWLKEFVNSSWYAEPGKQFLYISENMYVLCAMIVRLTGMSVTDFLTPRLYEPLGIEIPYWETDPGGIETGGWGLMLKTEDLAKFTLCYQQGGKYNGKQVIPEWWVDTATVVHADSSKSKKEDSQVGYGYCFWMCRGCENSYRSDGMYSQFGIVLKDYDACIITTSGEIRSQPYKDVIWEYFPKAFKDDLDTSKTTELSIAPYEKLPINKHSPMEKKIECQRIVFSRPFLLNIVGMPVSTITMPALYMEKDKAGNISNVSFKFYPKYGVMIWTEGNEVNAVHFGLDGEYRWDYMYIGGVKYQTCSIATWNNPKELELHLRAIETVSERVFVFNFNGKNKVLLKPSSKPTILSMQAQLEDSIQDVVPNETIQNFVNKMLPKVLSLVDAKHYGIIT